MSDISVAPEQDAIAESLLGEPEEQQTAETTGTEPQEAVQELEPEQAEAEPLEEEAAEEWLPSDQDKVFPDDVYARYAQRYQLTPEQAADPLLRQLLHDKINTDIFVRQQMQQQQELEQQFQEPEEEQQEPTPQAQPLDRQQYFAQLDRMIQERTDPEVAKAFHADFLRAFGVPEAEIAKMPPTQAMQFTTTASKYMLNLVNTFMGDMLQATLPQQLTQAFPGFGDMYERSAYAMAWDRVRNSDPKFSELPSYGSKDFSAKLRTAAQQIPGFDEMQFTGRNGQPLAPMENAIRKYSMLAQQITGQVDPQLLQRAAAAQAQSSRRAAVKRSAGNLGSGQSKAGTPSQASSSKFTTNTDLFDDDTMEMYKREHGRL